MDMNKEDKKNTDKKGSRHGKNKEKKERKDMDEMGMKIGDMDEMDKY